MPRKEKRLTFMRNTPKGKKAFSEVSKADLVDILYYFACMHAGQELTIDEYSQFLLTEKGLLSSRGR